MCSKPSVNVMQSMLSNNNTTSNVVQQISSMKLRHSRDQYYIVDIREADEKEIKEGDDPSFPDDIQPDICITMGCIFRSGRTGEFNDTWNNAIANNKTIVLVCTTGYRASITATEMIMNQNMNNVTYLMNGLIGLNNPSATIPDLLVVLCTKSNAEKITLALNACAVAAKNGETVILALMADGVCTFLRKGNNKEVMSSSDNTPSFRVTETFIGEPFKPCEQLLNAFLGTGNGIVLGCKSCVKNRQFEYGSDLLDCVKPTQMPDLLRMLSETKKTLQFM